MRRYWNTLEDHNLVTTMALDIGADRSDGRPTALSRGKQLTSKYATRTRTDGSGAASATAGAPDSVPCGRVAVFQITRAECGLLDRSIASVQPVTGDGGGGPNALVVSGGGDNDEKDDASRAAALQRRQAQAAVRNALIGGSALGNDDGHASSGDSDGDESVAARDARLLRQLGTRLPQQAHTYLHTPVGFYVCVHTSAHATATTVQVGWTLRLVRDAVELF